LDVDLLMVQAAVIAAGMGQVLDGALLIVIFAGSGALEAVVTARTRDSVRELLDLTPPTATRLLPDGREQTVRATELTAGDLVLVRPGDRVCADGTVLDGCSEVDQASITGEPLPALKNAGSQVFAGTLNGTGALTVRVDRPAAQSVVAQVVALVEEASGTKARGQLFIETFEQRYSVVMAWITLGLVAIPVLTGTASQSTLLRAMTFMIVASPCAVVLATMPPLLAAVANAGRHGVLVKSAIVLERLAGIDLVAFDKTGTLTEGTPVLVDVHLLPAAGHDRDCVLRLAAAAEQRSEHPLARAVVAAATAAGIVLPPVHDFGSTPGRGVVALVEGRRVEVGGPSLLDGTATAQATGLPSAAHEMALVEAAGRTPVLVVVDHTPVAVLTLTDRLRPFARETVADLAALTGADPLLLTGDGGGPARAVAAATGIHRVHARLLPADKLDVVRTHQAAGRRVLLVGDGVNDAPALAAADVGVALGRHGADLALQSADAVVLADDLAVVPALIMLARRDRRVVVGNLVLATTVITILSAWNFTVGLPLPLAVAGHEGSTVLVGLNGLRLLRHTAWPTAAGRRPRLPNPRRHPPAPAGPRAGAP
jgi:heavy metal translocating P-type ATPase